MLSDMVDTISKPLIKKIKITRAPHVGALYARRMSRSMNKLWNLYLSLTSAFICSSTAHDQSSYQVQLLSLIKFFKIYSRHGFCIKCYCNLDIWSSDLKMYRGHLLSMTNLPTKYDGCQSEIVQDIERTRLLHKMLLWPWHLTC